MKKVAAVVMCALALVASSAQAGNAKEEANKKKVVEFYEKVLNQKDVAAIDKYLGRTGSTTRRPPTAPRG